MADEIEAVKQRIDALLTAAGGEMSAYEVIRELQDEFDSSTLSTALAHLVSHEQLLLDGQHRLRAAEAAAR